MKRLLPYLLLIFLLCPALAEACQQYRDVMLDRNGHVIANVAISITLTGTPTLAILYSDPLCSVVIPNPIFSSPAGEFIFYVHDGEYGVAFSKTGYTFVNIDRLSIYDPLGENIHTVARYTTSTTDTDICAPGQGAIDAIGATEVTLVVNKNVSCSTTKTIPDNVKLQFMGAGLITVAGGQTLTIDGPVIAGDQNIFAGTGLVAGIRDVNSAWFGTTGDGVTNDAAALQKAIDAIDTSSSKSGLVRLPAGTYLIGTTTLNLRDRVIVEGADRVLAIISYTGTAEAVLSDCNGQTGFRNLELQTTSTNANVIALHIKCLTGSAIGFTYDFNKLKMNATSGVQTGQIGVKINGTGSLGIYAIEMLQFEALNYDNPVVLTANAFALNLSGALVRWGTATNDAAVALTGDRHNIDVDLDSTTITDGIGVSVAGSNNHIKVRGNVNSSGRYYSYTSGTGNVFFGQKAPPVAPTYGANITIDCRLGDWFIVTVTNNSAFNFLAPTFCMEGKEITLTIKNTSGGAHGAVTLNAAYHHEPTGFGGVATGFHTSISFRLTGAVWTEVNRTWGPVAN